MLSKNEPQFNGVYSRNNRSIIKDGAYVTNLDEYKSRGTHWIALYINSHNATSFGSWTYSKKKQKNYQQRKY